MRGPSPSRPHLLPSGVLRAFLVLFLLANSWTVQTFAAAPLLVRVEPLAIVPGKETALHLLGENLGGAAKLWTSFPCEGSLDRGSGSVPFALRIPSMPAGLGAIRLVSTNGMSGLHLLLIDPVAAVPAHGTNRSIGSAQPLTSNTAADGWCDELQSAFYRLEARKGERLALEVVAQRLGSLLDPLLRVLDAAGQDVASNDDAPGLGADARIEFRAASSGDYFVEVRDTRYAGSPRHRYRLRLAAPLPNPLPFLGKPGLMQFTAPLVTPPILSERESNDVQPQSFTPPVQLVARFDAPGDRDVFAFRAAKGERLLFTGRTRSLGSPCDLLLRIQSTNGTPIAESNATGSDEGLLTNRFTEAGTFQLVVEELNRLGGHGLDYQVAVEPWKPGFQLSTETERFSVPAGETIEIDVQAQRRDYDGPISLKLVGLEGDFAATNAIIAAKTNATKLRVTVPAELPLGEYFQFSLVGSADLKDRLVTARVSTAPALRALFPEMRHPPAELDGLMTLSISESKSTSPPPARKKRK